MNWFRHQFRGWVCRACGYHAVNQAAVDVHDRRAVRGLGCAALEATK